MREHILVRMKSAKQCIKVAPYPHALIGELDRGREGGAAGVVDACACKRTIINIVIIIIIIIIIITHVPVSTRDATNGESNAVILREFAREHILKEVPVSTRPTVKTPP